MLLKKVRLVSVFIFILPVFSILISYCLSSIPNLNAQQITPTKPCTDTAYPKCEKSPNFLQIAKDKWYFMDISGCKLDIGFNPRKIAFDGENIWVMIGFTVNKVAVIRPSDGNVLAIYPETGDFGIFCGGLAIDAFHAWIGDHLGGQLYKIKLKDGSQACAPISVGGRIQGMCFDGENIWAANIDDPSLCKVRASDGNVIKYPVPSMAIFPLFDWTNVWASLVNDGKILKMRPSDGAILGTYPVGNSPEYATFDGESIWVPCSLDNTVYKIDAKTGVLKKIVQVDQGPSATLFDGRFLYASCKGSGSAPDSTVSMINPQTGHVCKSFPTGGISSWEMCFDGIHIWVSNSGESTVSKM